MGKAADTQQHLSLQLQGLVQGVGFRPHVVRLAAAHGLRGTVCNSSAGVQLELEGLRPNLRAFLTALLHQPPPLARIDAHQIHWSSNRAMPAGMRILPPSSTGDAAALMGPDLAICPRCLAELQDPANRRHGYPFISCCHCGPRYSVLEQLPFEREHTSFRALQPCPACQREFCDPADRRFHAQTISCPACGPQLAWNGAPISSAAALEATASALEDGAIVALQGIGGFQLLVDPANTRAVQELRRRKGRPEKPLALLASAAWVEQHCRISPQERDLWQGAAAPILLLRRNTLADRAVAEAVAGSSPWLGVMRACSGLHHRVLERCGGVVVATSANRSGEPITADGLADAPLLHALADHVLSHSLRVVNRIDDSVLRWAAGGALILRMGRGLAPLAVPGGSDHAGGLALGAQVKGSFALGTHSHHLLSPDLGDLSSLAGAQHHQNTCLQWLQRHGLAVSYLACDRHPGYSASQWAGDLASSHQLPFQGVQHHHAHVLAVMAEHKISGPALGVAWDGSGQGDDGTLWGGEALAINSDGYQRIAHLRSWPLPGGERAQREPRRAALGLLLEAFGSHWREQPTPLAEAFTAEERVVLERSTLQGINSPRCSSVGRLFDAVAALLGIVQQCSYEAQAAMALEGLGRQALEQHPGASCQLDLPLQQMRPGEPWQWNWQPLLEQLLEAQRHNISPEAIALAFHQALAHGIGDLAQLQGRQQLLLAGGCFQNALLLELTTAALDERGCQALWPQRLPCNDAALPIGQLLASETMLIKQVAPQADCHVSGRCR